MTIVLSSRKLDRDGVPLRQGDTVKIVGMPDLSQMSRACRKESQSVFEYLQKKYKRIKSFDEHGFAEIEFRIASEADHSIHTVWIEPHLLKRKRHKAIKRTDSCSEHPPAVTPDADPASRASVAPTAGCR